MNSILYGVFARLLRPVNRLRRIREFLFRTGQRELSDHYQPACPALAQLELKVRHCPISLGDSNQGGPGKLPYEIAIQRDIRIYMAGSVVTVLNHC
jgi:hypothetical protein